MRREEVRQGREGRRLRLRDETEGETHTHTHTQRKGRNAKEVVVLMEVTEPCQ